MKDENILFYMRLALSEAERAEKSGEVPVGAVAVLGAHIIAKAHNQPVKKNDPTAHAEILLLRKAAAKLSNYRLKGLSIYVTKEPCPMCAGALINARVAALFFGCYDEKSGACGSVLNVADNKKLNHRIKITGGVLEKDCRSLIQKFFKCRR